MLRLLQMGPSKVLTTFLNPIQSSWQLSLLELPPCRNTVTLSSNSSDMYTSTVQPGPSLLTQHSCSTLVSKPLIPHLPIPYLLSLPLHHHPLLTDFLPRLLPPLTPDSLRVLQWHARGLRARSNELLHFLSSHPADLICIQESNLNSFSSFRIPGFSALRSDRTHSRSAILSSDTTHASGGVVIFVRQGLSFSKLSTSSLSSLDPYSDYVGINNSLNNSSSLSFLNVYTPLFAPPQRMAEPTLFLPPFFPPPEISSFWGTSIAITPSGTQEVLPTHAGRKYSTGSSLLKSSPLNDPDTPTLLHRSSGSRSSPEISFAPSSLVLSCSWEVLQDLGSDHLPILLSIPLSPVFRPNELPLPSIFRKLAEMALPPTLTLTVLQQRNTRLFLFPLLLLSLPLWH